MTSRDLRRSLESFEDGDLSRIKRQEKLRYQQLLRDAEEAKRQAEHNAKREEMRARNAEMKVKAGERKKLDDEAHRIAKRDEALDRDIRRHLGCVRIRPLGKDRFWNKYWWLDAFGSGLAAVNELSQSTKASAHLIPFGTGRLWVEGAGHPQWLGTVSGVRSFDVSRARDSHHLRFLKARDQGEIQVNNFLNEAEWAFFSEPEEVFDQLSIVWICRCFGLARSLT
jgi:hypothetical protein